MGTRDSFSGVKGAGVMKLTSHLHLVPRLRMTRAAHFLELCNYVSNHINTNFQFPLREQVFGCCKVTTEYLSSNYGHRIYFF
jgi:hypothetical protein